MKEGRTITFKVRRDGGKMEKARERRGKEREKDSKGKESRREERRGKAEGRNLEKKEGRMEKRWERRNEDCRNL